MFACASPAARATLSVTFQPEGPLTMPTLFDPVTLGAIHAPNRILMSPLTRGRAGRDGVPGELMATYYAQRASAGLIISEAVGISREGLGWPYAPGLWDSAQVDGWAHVTDAVHAAGGRIVAQLWHMGRLVHPSLGGAAPVSASATTGPGLAHTYEGKQPYAEARALPAPEIARVVDDYARAARHARAAGFDGVQLHGANGYLIDQFLRDSTNLRDDDYGGSIVNRLRLLGEVVDALGAEIGGDQVSVRLSPNGEVQGCNDSDHVALFTAAAALLETKGIGWLELREGRRDGSFVPTSAEPVAQAMRTRYTGALVLNGDYDLAMAADRVGAGEAEAISFGRAWIANPDLVARFASEATLNAPDPKTFYSHGPEGYTDYAAMAG